MSKTFKILRENVRRILSEAQPAPKASSDTKGKLHELLVGGHLLGGKDMEHHTGDDGTGRSETPTQALNRLRDSISPEEFNKINARAKAAAEDIRKRVEQGGHKINDVHWTSQPGDIGRSTGIESTQKEDASDIVVHTSKGGKKRFHGVSLKVTDEKSHDVPVSNPGMESTLGGDEMLAKHREGLHRTYPELQGLNKEGRKKLMASNPKMDADIRTRNAGVLQGIASNLADKLNSMSPKERAAHIRTHVLQAHQTPMQQQGHNHIRHTAYLGSGGSHAFHGVTPSEDYNHILNDPGNITVEHSGTSVHFLYKGKKFARHRMKFESQSDPLSSVKGSGEPITMK
jgi:hypothetical protein